jgi:hypothetical protein
MIVVVVVKKKKKNNKNKKKKLMSIDIPRIQSKEQPEENGMTIELHK